MPEYRHTLKKHERLKSRKLIDKLFLSGHTVKKYPIRLVYLPITEADHKLQAGFSVPKRLMKRAVDRNLLKRRMREAYRIHNHKLKELIHSADQAYILMLIYTGREIHDYDKIEKGVVRSLGLLVEEIKA